MLKVALNARPLAWQPCGTRTYFENLLSHLSGGECLLDLFSDKRFTNSSADELNTAIVGPEANNLKTTLLWEMVSFPARVRKQTYDLVHIPYHATTVWAPCPVVMTIHDAILWDQPRVRTLADRMYLRFLDAGGRHARMIIAVSEFAKTRIAEALSIPHERIVVIPEAASLQLTMNQNCQGSEQLRMQYRLDKPYILYVGGTAQRKGIDRLITAYQQLDQDLKRLYDLVIVGRLTPDIKYQADILAAMASEPIGRIVNIPVVSNEALGDIYRRAKVFVFPSFSEGFGLPPLEAMACGTPVITSNRTSMPEIVGDAAILFDPDDIESLVKSITELLTTPSLCAELAARGLERTKLYSWSRTAALTLKAYEQAAGR